VDYLTPQLYWTLDRPRLGFATYMKWWLAENPLGRHIWPGMNASKVGEDRKAGEILAQISCVRSHQLQMLPGHFHWHLKPLLADVGKLGSLCQKRAYPVRTLIPPSPWLAAAAQPLPAPQLEKTADGQHLRWRHLDPRYQSLTRWWILQVKKGSDWPVERVLFRDLAEVAWPAGATAVSVRAADAAWHLGEVAVLMKEK
jgi:hypothetical protein